MKETFCPRCGAKIKSGLKFCPNCGHKFEVAKSAKSNSTIQSPTLTRMGQKKQLKLLPKLIAILAVVMVAIAGICIFYVLMHANSASPKTTSNKAQSSDAITFTKKAKQNKQLTLSKADWMLMGYMAYARQNYVESDHIKNTTDLVNAVSQDLTDKSLKAASVGNDYYLANKYGSVKVQVLADQVKVFADDTYTSDKSELKQTFKPYFDQIQQMTNQITTGTAAEFTELNDDEYIVAAFVAGDKNKSIPLAKLAEVKKDVLKFQTDKGKGLDIGYYPQGFFTDAKLGKAIAINMSTSGFISYKISNGQIKATSRQGGTVYRRLTFTLADLKAKYGPYKNQLDQIIQGLQYNKAHVKEAQKIVNHQ